MIDFLAKILELLSFDKAIRCFQDSIRNFGDRAMKFGMLSALICGLALIFCAITPLSAQAKYKFRLHKQLSPHWKLQKIDSHPGCQFLSLNHHTGRSEWPVRNIGVDFAIVVKDSKDTDCGAEREPGPFEFDFTIPVVSISVVNSEVVRIQFKNQICLFSNNGKDLTLQVNGEDLKQLKLGRPSSRCDANWK